ncbi:MAG: hypothetical protein R3301_13820 [Saprospiraceae bacterium]|nr:hypothetical protein [Saprospiraceae bacterium]
MKRRVLMIGIAMGLIGQIAGQSRSYLNPKTGLAVLRLSDENSFNDDLRYYGHTYGVDGIVEEANFFLMAGLHYQRVALEGSASGTPFAQRENFHQLHVPVHLGVSVPGDGHWWALRAYAGGHVHAVFAVDDNTSGLDLDQVTGFNPGWQLGIQAMLRPVTLDLQAVWSGRKFIVARPESRFRGVMILAGILF